MVWLKKEILFILSLLFLGLLSCKNKVENSKNEEIEEVVIEVTITDKITLFFENLKTWNEENTVQINQLGKEISTFDSTLQFYPNTNTYDDNSFIFSSLKEENLTIFKNHPFLEEDEPHQFSSYKVWRKKVNNRKILDLSIEPHPTLNWIFVIRKREQE